MKAILVTSTPQATGFWLKFLSEVEPNNRFNTPVIRSSKLDSKVQNATKELSDRQKKHFKEGLREFHAVQCPLRELKPLYSSFGRTFKGKPYRYATDVTTHIWFDLKPSNKSSSKSIKSRPSKSNVLMTSDILDKDKRKKGSSKKVLAGRK